MSEANSIPAACSTVAAYEFDSFPDRKLRVEVRETEEGIDVVIAGLKTDVIVISGLRDQWGTWITVADKTVAQEDGTRSFAEAMIAALQKFKEHTEYQTLPPTDVSPSNSSFNEPSS